MTGEDGAGSASPSRPDCSGKRFALVAARFYPELSDQMLEGARRALLDCGVADDAIERYDVPGCFELPFACRKLAGEIDYDGFVALGVVIRGETPHFDYVAGECARGLMDVQLQTGIPIGFGVLTTDSMAQAQKRADPARGNKGYQAALAAAHLTALSATVARAGFRK